MVAVRPSPGRCRQERVPGRAARSRSVRGGAWQTCGEDKDGGREAAQGPGSDDAHGLPVVLRSGQAAAASAASEVDGSADQGLAEEDGSDAGVPDARQSGDVGDAAGEHEFCTGSRDEVGQLVEVGLRAAMTEARTDARRPRPARPPGSRGSSAGRPSRPPPRSARVGRRARRPASRPRSAGMPPGAPDPRPPPAGAGRRAWLRRRRPARSAPGRRRPRQAAAASPRPGRWPARPRCSAAGRPPRRRGRRGGWPAPRAPRSDERCARVGRSACRCRSPRRARRRAESVRP